MLKLATVAQRTTHWMPLTVEAKKSATVNRRAIRAEVFINRRNNNVPLRNTFRQGGIKAVVWTDVLQMTLMIVGFLLVCVKGSLMVGGVGAVFEIASRQEVLDIFDFSLNFHKTFTFWSVMIGSGIFWTMSYCANQAMVQRFCGLPTLKHGRRALYMNAAGVCATMLLSIFSGLVLYAVYHRCDPVKASVIRKYDQLMPLLVTDAFSHMPGIPGLFVAAVYSGSLSTMSSGYNALAALTWEDFLKTRVKLSPSRTLWLTKALAAFYGLLVMGIAFMAGKITSILQAAASTTGAFNGALGATFFVGLLFPWCGKKTAFVSLFAGLGTSIWVATGGFVYPRPPYVVRTTLDRCDFNYTLKEVVPINHRSGGIFELYHISYLWVPAISFGVTWVAAVFLTVLTGLRSADHVDPALLAPCIRGLYRWYVKATPSTKPSNSEEKNVDFSNKKRMGDRGHINRIMTEDYVRSDQSPQSTYL